MKIPFVFRMMGIKAETPEVLLAKVADLTSSDMHPPQAYEWAVNRMRREAELLKSDGFAVYVSKTERDLITAALKRSLGGMLGVMEALSSQDGLGPVLLFEDSSPHYTSALVTPYHGGWEVSSHISQFTIENADHSYRLSAVPEHEQGMLDWSMHNLSVYAALVLGLVDLTSVKNTWAKRRKADRGVKVYTGKRRTGTVTVSYTRREHERTLRAPRWYPDGVPQDPTDLKTVTVKEHRVTRDINLYEAHAKCN